MKKNVGIRAMLNVADAPSATEQMFEHWASRCQQQTLDGKSGSLVCGLVQDVVIQNDGKSETVMSISFAGGGVALLYGQKALANLKYANDDQRRGIDIVRMALQAPVRQIAENAGIDGSIVVGKLQESTDTNYGYDAQKNEFTDMVKSGIIDPVKVVRSALQFAASVAGLLVTTEAMVAERPEKKGPPMQGGGGMGGMGDMDF
jgi:chaperonin GroEL (HSP60 family)